MRQVQLEETEMLKDEISLVSIFVQSAYTQGFDIDWVEAVIVQAIANNYINFRHVMLAHIEIVPAA